MNPFCNDNKRLLHIEKLDRHGEGNWDPCMIPLEYQGILEIDCNSRFVVIARSRIPLIVIFLSLIIEKISPCAHRYRGVAQDGILRQSVHSMFFLFSGGRSQCNRGLKASSLSPVNWGGICGSETKTESL